MTARLPRCLFGKGRVLHPAGWAVPQFQSAGYCGPMIHLWTTIAGMYGRRSSHPRSDAAIDRLGRRFGTSEFRGMASLRHSVYVAISPLHGDCLDVSRRLPESLLACCHRQKDGARLSIG